MLNRGILVIFYGFDYGILHTNQSDHDTLNIDWIGPMSIIEVGRPPSCDREPTLQQNGNNARPTHDSIPPYLA